MNENQTNDQTTLFEEPKAEPQKRMKLTRADRIDALMELASKHLKEYGYLDGIARFKFMDEVAEKPEYEDFEIAKAWAWAVEDYRSRVSEDTRILDKGLCLHDCVREIEMMLETFSDIEEARLFREAYQDTARYAEGIGWLHFNGKTWEKNNSLIRTMVRKVSDIQLKEVQRDLVDAVEYLLEAQKRDSPADIQRATDAVEGIQKYKRMVVNRRQSSRITSTLKEAQGYLFTRCRRLKPSLLVGFRRSMTEAL